MPYVTIRDQNIPVLATAMEDPIVKPKQVADEDAAAQESGSYSESAEEEDFDGMTVEQLQGEITRTRDQIAKLELDLGVDEKRDDDEVCFPRFFQLTTSNTEGRKYSLFFLSPPARLSIFNH